MNNKKIVEFLKIAAKELAKADKMKMSLEKLELADNAKALVNLCNRALEGDLKAMDTIEHMHFV